MGVNVDKIRSTNIEIGNNFKILNHNVQKVLTFCSFGIRICFGFRASNFEFKNFFITNKNSTGK